MSSQVYNGSGGREEDDGGRTSDSRAYAYAASAAAAAAAAPAGAAAAKNKPSVARSFSGSQAS